MRRAIGVPFARSEGGLPGKLTRDEAVRLVTLIMRLDYADHAELNNSLNRLERDLDYPDISELIFAVNPELTAAQVVDRATAYRPTELPEGDPVASSALS